MEKNANGNELFSLEKVRALKGYFTQCRAGLKGRPEWNDYDTAAKVCDQLAAMMTPDEPTPVKPARGKPEGAANA